jgi:hypothetical protein
MRPTVIGPFFPAAQNLTRFRSNATGVDFALSQTTTGDGLAHIIIVTNDSATDHSAKTLVLVGTDADGNALTETMAAPAGSTTSSSTYHYLTLTSTTPSATIGADTFDIGMTGVSVSNCVPMNWRANPFSVGLLMDITGTINVTAQHTFGDVWSTIQPEKLTWMPHATIVSKTADTDSNYAYPIRATRVLVNSVTAASTTGFVYTIIQGGPQ